MTTTKPDLMPEALAAYDSAFAETGIPAMGLYAAASVLGLDVRDAFNDMADRGHLVWEFFLRPDDRKNGLGVRVVRRPVDERASDG